MKPTLNLIMPVTCRSFCLDDCGIFRLALALGRSDAALTDVTIREPTLDDVFLTLTRSPAQRPLTWREPRPRNPRGASPGQAFVVSQVNGTWHRAQTITAALNNSAPDNGGPAQVTSMSCPAAGRCTAGGYYFSEIGGAPQYAFVAG